MMDMKRTILITLALLSLAGCGNKDDWTAFVFPDQSNIPHAGDVEPFIYGKYPTFEACQTAAIDAVRASDAQTGMTGDYECGFKCSHRDNMGGLLVCKEDRK
uniref:Lipoprotein n=1 Tax=Caulobacter sp. (strain K31) TaxID=366602 RepID=B0SWG3_CAUSK